MNVAKIGHGLLYSRPHSLVYGCIMGDTAEVNRHQVSIRGVRSHGHSNDFVTLEHFAGVWWFASVAMVLRSRFSSQGGVTA